MNLPASISLTIAVAALLSSPGWANATACTNGSLSRSIDIVYSDPGHPVPCEVIYDKSAEGAGQHSLWRADSEAGYCEAQAAAFVAKLSGFGWSCDTSTSAPELPDEQPQPADELLGESAASPADTD